MQSIVSNIIALFHALKLSMKNTTTCTCIMTKLQINKFKYTCHKMQGTFLTQVSKFFFLLTLNNARKQRDKYNFHKIS